MALLRLYQMNGFCWMTGLLFKHILGFQTKKRLTEKKKLAITSEAKLAVIHIT